MQADGDGELDRPLLPATGHSTNAARHAAVGDTRSAVPAPSGMSKATWFAWVMLGIVTQLGQGMWPVWARFLQTNSTFKLPVLQLSFSLNTVAALAFALLYELPAYFYRRVKRHEVIVHAIRRSEASQQATTARTADVPQDAPSRPGLGTGNGDSAPTNGHVGSCGDAISPGCQDVTSAGEAVHSDPVLVPIGKDVKLQTGVGAGVEKVSWARWLLVCATAAGFMATSTVLLLVSVYFTEAYWSQLIFLLSPLFVALLAAMLYGDEIFSGFWATVGGTIVGAALVVWGGLRAKGVDVSFTPSDGIGMAIAVVATFCLALYIVLLQHSEGVVNLNAVLWANFVFQIPVILVLSLIIERPHWTFWHEFDLEDWSSFLCASIGVSFGCNMLQQCVIRAIGGVVFATFMPVRMLSAAVGTWLMMSERLDDPVQLAGSLLIIAVVTAFLCKRALASSQPPPSVDPVEEGYEQLSDV